MGGIITQEEKARVYFCGSKIARIHNLENPCPDGKYITEGNYGDALAEIENRNKEAKDCKKCENGGG